jgi:hypothetical protein
MSDVKTITSTEAGELVKNYKGGQFFTVTFTKRSDGSERVMNCRKGVKKDVNGEGHRYNVESKGLVCVRDVQKQAHRMIPLESIKRIKMAGKTYKVTP